MSRFLTLFLLFLFAATTLGAPVATDAINLWSPPAKNEKNVSPTNAFTDAAGFATDKDLTIEVLVGSIINALLGLLGVIFIGLIIYGGFKWMNAQGNEDEVKTAKNILTQATIGLVIVLAAFVISRFVISRLTAKTLKQSMELVLPLFV